MKNKIAPIVLMIMAAALILFATFKLTRTEARDPWRGNSSSLFDVSIEYDPSANYCTDGSIPLFIKVLSKDQPVERVVLGYYSDTLIMEQTNDFQGTLNLQPLEAGVPALYPVTYKQEPPATQHYLYFYPTDVEEEGIELEYDVSGPSLMKLSSPKDIAKDTYNSLSFNLLNCNEEPVDNVLLTIKPSATIDITQPVPYATTKITEGDNAGDWVMNVGTLPEKSSKTVTLNFVPRSQTSDLSINLQTSIAGEAETLEEGEEPTGDSLHLSLGQVN